MTARVALFWIATGLAVLIELAAVALMLRPDVDSAYRAYYIDKTSDCWPHKTAAAYELGTPLYFSHIAPGVAYTANKICGWFYPDSRGTWSYGRFSRLEFNFSPLDIPLRLTLTAAGMVEAGHGSQRVVVSANGHNLGTLIYDSPVLATHSLAVPAELAATGKIDLRFDYPDARPGTEMGPNVDPHLRAIEVQVLTLGPAI